MPYFDVSVPLRAGLPVYEGDPPLRLARYASIAAGSPCNLTRIDMGLHAGTHIDAPLHFIDGAAGVEAVAPDSLMGPAFVADVAAARGDIDEATLDALAIPPGVSRVLFKTRNAALWRLSSLSSDYCALTEGAACALVERGVRLVGIDYLSIAPAADPAPVHIALLRSGAVILEGLDLSGVEEGHYDLACLPLLIPGADGAPARALLSRDA